MTPPGPNGAVRIKGWWSLTEVNTGNIHLFIFITCFFSGFYFAEEQRPRSVSDCFVKIVGNINLQHPAGVNTVFFFT